MLAVEWEPADCLKDILLDIRISNFKLLSTLVDLNKDDLVIVGSGDDAAVIKSQEKDLVHSIDISKINSHFPQDSMPQDIAYRSIAVALSDLAAMGAFPAFISIGLTSNITDLKWYKQFTAELRNIE